MNMMSSQFSRSSINTGDKRKLSVTGNSSEETTLHSSSIQQLSFTSDKSKYMNVPFSVENLKPKPKRPLSAYNIFFREERQRIMADLLSTDEDGAEYDTKRRRTGKNGKISFSDMGKRIGHNWRNLDEASIAHCRELSEVDAERYRTEMKEWTLQEENLRLSKHPPTIKPKEEIRPVQEQYAKALALARARFNSEITMAAFPTSMMAPSHNRWPLLRQESMTDPDFLSGMRKHEPGLLPRSVSAGYPIRPLGMGYPSPIFYNKPNNADLDVEKLLLEKRLMENFLLQTQRCGLRKFI